MGFLTPLLSRWARREGFRLGTLWRALLCWALGCFFLLSDESSGFDRRFQVRGDHLFQHEIVLITIRPSELTTYRKSQFLGLESSDSADVTDSSFWNKHMWTALLERVLAQSPKNIGVTFYFRENLSQLNLTEQESGILFDARVFWGSPSTGAERPPTPLLARSDQSNVGVVELIRDGDGVIRRLAPSHPGFPLLIEALSGKTVSQFETLNFKGSQRIFPTYSLSDVILGRVPPKAFSGKYVLIGPDISENMNYISPLGPTHRAAVVAQELENLISQSFIRSAPIGANVIFLLFLEVIAILIITQYPHAVAFVLLSWLCTALMAASVWIFDTYSFWIPLWSPFLLMLTTWIVFIGYQANKIERRNFALKQEQKALHELEQLKNNFVSLISHDLKTPIAKIRAIVDRMILSTPAPVEKDDLFKLQDYSDELNRYIQSILKVLRVESREFRLQIDIGDINETIEHVLEQIQPLAGSKDIKIVSQLEPLFSIEADFTLLHEVILNLIENSIKYSPPGSSIQVTSSEIDNYVRVDVQDQGPGISPYELQSIWGKFVRGKDQDLKTKGSGLGLYLVKYFVELHGGRVGIESSLGKGTRVFFLLPIEASADLTHVSGVL